MDEDLQLFRTVFRDAARTASQEWAYQEPTTDFHEIFERRLPADIRAELGRGIADGLLLIDGWRFRLAGLGPLKGPYAFFSKNRGPGVPSPNWEYYVQVAEYLRLHRELSPRGWTIGFEDGLMDVSVRAGDDLIWCIEVKEKAAKLEALLTAMEQCGRHVPIDQPDRGNDPLRKAKYLIRHRPPYLTGVAIGRRRHFAVSYPGEVQFAFQPLAAAPRLREE